MKVFIEGSPLFGKRTGVGQYTSRLLGALIKLDTTNSYTAFGFLLPTRKVNVPNNGLRYRYVRWMPGRVYSRLLKKHLAPPIDLLVGKADLFIFPNFVRWPLAGNEKSIVVVYDLSYLLHGQHSQNANKAYLTSFVPPSVKKADIIITISENSKKEIIEHYGVGESKIHIVHPAIDHAEYYPRSEQEVAAMQVKFKLEKPYILFTGTIEPRKNIVGILDAYSRLPVDVRSAYSLVLAGGKGWKNTAIQQKLDDLAALDIRQTGYVSDGDLPALYSGASLFVYPSFYEGFGMPPLEAMACGTPVITANNSSLPEVVGDAGIMVDAEDTRALTDQMTLVLTDTRLAAKLRDKGIVQAQKFNWDTSARRLLDAIDMLKQ